MSLLMMGELFLTLNRSSSYRERAVKIWVWLLEGSAGHFWQRMFFPRQDAERDPLLSPLV